jgi:hypothetical protein
MSLGATQPLVAVHPIDTDALIDRDRCRDFHGNEASAATIAGVQCVDSDSLKVRFAFQQSCGTLDTLFIR